MIDDNGYDSRGIAIRLSAVDEKLDYSILGARLFSNEFGRFSFHCCCFPVEVTGGGTTAFIDAKRSLNPCGTCFCFSSRRFVLYQQTGLFRLASPSIALSTAG